MTTAAQRPDQIALRSPDDAFSLTFAQLERRLAATASVLHDLGLRKGDALGLMLLNRPEFHVVDAAAMLLGATPFSLYNTSPAEQIAFVMGDAGNRLVVAEPRFLDVVRQAAGDGVRVVELDELDGGDEDFDLEAHWRAVAPEDVLTLIYTSGTTGPPKGVELTHANMLAELRGVHAAVPLEGGGRWVSFLPSAHVADRWGSHYSALMTYGHTVTPVADPTQVFAVVAQVRPDRLRRRAARVGEAQGGARGLGCRGAGARRAPRAPRLRRGALAGRRRGADSGRGARVLRRARHAHLRGVGHERDLVHRHHQPPGRDEARLRRPAGRRHGAVDRRRRRAARARRAGDGRLSQPPRPHGAGDRRRRLAAHRRRRAHRRGRLSVDRRPQEGAHHQRRRQEHLAGQHRGAA